MCKVLSSALVLCFCFKTAIALSVKDIPYNQVSSKKIINIVDAVHQHAEPYCQYWNRNWESPSVKNTVKTTLFYALSQIDTLLKETENMAIRSEKSDQLAISESVSVIFEENVY